MQRERPNAVLVMAIFNFVVGGIYLISGLCGGLLLVFMAVMKNLAPLPGAGRTPSVT